MSSPGSRPARRVVIEADGGSRGNPGPAAYGAVLKDADTGVVIAEDGWTICVASNNVAEYSGLIAGLELAREYTPDAEVEVRMDSKLVVEQMSGRWQIKHPGLRPLAAQAAALVRRFDQVQYGWIPRERNRAAEPWDFAQQVLADAGDDRRIFLVWAGQYRTFGRDCQRLVYALRGARSDERLVQRERHRYYEPMWLDVFAPA